MDIILITLLILIMVVVMLFAVKKLLLIKNNIYSTHKSMSGGSVNENIKIPKMFPQVGVLTNRILQTTPIDKFVWLEKTDGLHTNLIIYENSLYKVIKGDLTFIKTLNDNTIGQTVLDTEFYEGAYYVFDASMIENEDISSLPFPIRMQKANQFLKKYKLENIYLKNHYPIKSLNDLVQYVNTNEVSPITGMQIDGIIFQRVDLPYFKSPTCFKLKRKVMNTIDFKLFYEETRKLFYLYLYGSYYDVIKNRKLLPHINKYSKKHTGIELIKNKALPDKLYVLFCSPYQEKLHEFKPRRRWNKNGYFDSNIDEINKLMNEIIENPESFNGSIIEMSLADDGWVPLRKRNDKEFSNSYNVGLSNCSVMFNPVNGNLNTYFTKTFAFPESITTPYHDINSIIRKYIVERSINPLNEMINVLDLAGGRGADELNLYCSGAYNIFAADADTEALVQYVERTTNTPNIKNEFLLKSSKYVHNMPRYITINAINAYLSENNDSIIKDIQSRFEYPKEGFDVILMNYAIHYLCYKSECILALNKLIKTLLKPGGIFIFSCFDGDSIINDIGNNKLLKLNSFDIELIDPPVDSDNDAIWAKMPLPTIDASGYRNEPLVQLKYLDLLNLSMIEHYYPLEECDVSKIKGHEKVEDYLSYINVYVMMNE